MWLGLIALCFFSCIIIQFIRLLLADGDLTLLLKEKFGKKPETLKGQVVWITGASGGIGEYLAYVLSKAGCKLILSARREQELERVKNQCLIHGSTKEDDIMVLPLDLLEFHQHRVAVDKVLQKFGQIDILVNNSGRSQRGLAMNTELDIDHDIMELNYFGTLSLTKAVLPSMLKRCCGHIVVTSSLAGKVGSPFSATYSATKFALQGWFETLRLELSLDNIHVTMICPGPVLSDIHNNAFSDVKGKPSSTKETETQVKKMSTERCAELMAIAIANKLDEVWIADQPVLGIVYVGQYMPDIARLFAKRFGMKQFMKMRFNTEHKD